MFLWVWKFTPEEYENSQITNYKMDGQNKPFFEQIFLVLLWVLQTQVVG